MQCPVVQATTQKSKCNLNGDNIIVKLYQFRTNTDPRLFYFSIQIL